VLTSVHLNDEALLKAHKIDDVLADRLLSAKLVTSKLAKPKMFP
jgi:hypothetical protein